LPPAFGDEEGHTQEKHESDDEGFGCLVEGPAGDVAEVTPVVVQVLSAPEEGLNPLGAVSGGPVVAVGKEKRRRREGGRGGED